MIAAWFILAFAICTPAGADICEDGIVIARSCAAGEAWIRASLRSGQTLHLMGCAPQRHGEPAW